MAEFGYATDDAVPGILARATARGCRVRILLLNPESQITEAIDPDEGHPPGTLTARITAALARFGQMRQACGTRMQIRVYDEDPTVSVSMESVGALMAARSQLQQRSRSPRSAGRLAGNVGFAALGENSAGQALVDARRVLGHLGLDFVLQVNAGHLGQAQQVDRHVSLGDFVLPVCSARLVSGLSGYPRPLPRTATGMAGQAAGSFITKEL
jgi:hypothetical protein